MVARKRARRRRWSRVAWLALWAVKGRPQKLTVFELLTVPEEAFEYHRWFYVGEDPEKPVASMHCSCPGYGSSHGASSYSLPQACKNLWEALRIRGLPAWYGKVVDERLRRPHYFDRTTRKRP